MMSGSFRFCWFAIAVAIVLSLQLASCHDVDYDLAPPTSTITVNWSSLIYTSTTHLTLQIVVNPLVTQESPIHSNVWESLRQLKSEYTRFAPWYPYPRLTIAELQPPSGVSTCSDVLEGNDIHLSCPDGVIDSIEFASFGTPHGTCTQYKVGSCDSPTSLSVISESCLNRTSCSIAATNAVFGGDPCHNTPKRLAVQVTCNPITNHTYWNFTLLDPIYHDFFTATEGRPTVMSVSPQPEWWYQFPNGDVPRVPDADMGLDWNYREGKILLDPTATTIGDYFGRVVAWYTSGGFTDEYGVFHQSNHHYNFTLWEVLNEPDYEHWNGIEQYTTIYDAVVHGIRRHAPEAAKNMKFVGLALGGPGDDLSRFTYFLNASNHAADVPVDWISYHFYVKPSSRTSPSTWSSEFRTQSDHFIDTVTKIQAIRAQLSPNTRTTIDELGCILPNDNDPNSADIPPIYWNACAGELAIMYTRLAELGIDVVGASQLVGYKKLNVMGGLPPQYPSVALLDWDTGVGNSHYWMLSLLLQFFGADVISKQAMFTTVTGQGHVFAQGWTLTRQDDTTQQIVLVVNQDYAPVNVMVQGMNGGMAYMLDVTCGLAPAYEMNLTSDTILFAEYAAAIIVAPNDATSTFSVSSF